MTGNSVTFKGKTEAIYKVIVVGDPAVGKTELLSKFTTNDFEEKYLPTVGVSILKEPIKLSKFNTTINLMFWDIAGQPQFYKLHHPYFTGADGMLLVFDMTRSSTFSNINNWYSSAVKYGLSGIPRVLIGNKAHLVGERRIILPMAAHLSEKLNAHYYETSPIDGRNVKAAFEKIAELIYITKKLNKPVKNQKLIVKTYQGETVETPKTEHIETPYKIDDPYWLDALDHSPNFPRYPSFPRSIRIRKVKKGLAKEKIHEKLICKQCGVTLTSDYKFCEKCGSKISR